MDEFNACQLGVLSVLPVTITLICEVFMVQGPDYPLSYPPNQRPARPIT